LLKDASTISYHCTNENYETVIFEFSVLIKNLLCNIFHHFVIKTCNYIHVVIIITKEQSKEAPMESVSNSVKRIIDRTPFLYEMLIQGILSYSNYAASILPTVEELHGKPVKTSAIVMAIRRYAEELRKKETEQKSYDLQYEIMMKTNICSINLVRSDTIMAKLGKLYNTISPASGDFLNVTLGSHEISLSISEKHLDSVTPLLEEETVLHQKGDLVALSLVFSGDFMSTPGIVYEAVRKLAWEEINVNEIISTMNELTFVIRREDSMDAFAVLQSFLGGA